MHDSDHDDLMPPTHRVGRARSRAVLAMVSAVGLLVALVGPAAAGPDAVAEARAALAARTAERQQAEQRVSAAEAAFADATVEVDRLGVADAQLTEQLTAARRQLREYAIAAYIDGGQSEVFRATLSLDQAQALAWQSSLLLGQSVAADEAADRYRSLRAANEPRALAAATAVDRAGAELQDARFDLIQAAGFERDAEAALALATLEAEQEAVARRAEAAAAAAARDAAGAAASSGTAPGAGSSVESGSGGGSSEPGRGSPSAAESATLARIRACESRGNYGIVSASGRYRGAYQFDVTTWRGVGGSGDPAAASAAEQDYRALLLLRMRGTRPWPICGR